MSVLLAPGKTSATSAPFTPGADPLTLYVTAGGTTRLTTSSNQINIERQTATGWQLVLQLYGGADSSAVIFLAKGTFRAHRPQQGVDTGFDVVGAFT